MKNPVPLRVGSHHQPVCGTMRVWELPRYTPREPPPELGTTMSGLPSPLRSPTAIPVGPEPVPTEAEGLVTANGSRRFPKPNSDPVSISPLKICTVLLPATGTATSGTPSPLKSPTATLLNPDPTIWIVMTLLKAPGWLGLFSTNVRFPLLTNTRSGTPSLLKSPLTTLVATGIRTRLLNAVEATNVVPVPRNNVAVPSNWLATMMSMNPSRLTSANATEIGSNPVVLMAGRPKVPSPRPAKTMSTL